MYSIVMLSSMLAGADVTPPPPGAPAPSSIAPAPFNVIPGALVTHGSTVAPIGWYGSCIGLSVHGVGNFSGMYSGGKHTKYTWGTPYSTTYVHPTDFGHPSHFAYPSAHAFPFGYSCAGTGHGGSMVIYGPTGSPIGLPPSSPYGYHTGLAPVWGSGAPVVLGPLTDTKDLPDTNPNRPLMMPPIAPPPVTKPGSDGTPMGTSPKLSPPAQTRLDTAQKPLNGGAQRPTSIPPLLPR